MNDQCSLLDKKCVPCTGTTPRLTAEQSKLFLKELSGWTVVDNKHLEKEFIFKNFKEGIAFIDKIASIAEAEGHHPDISLYGYKKVKIILSTHAIGGLSENDFIVAAKIDAIFL